MDDVILLYQNNITGEVYDLASITTVATLDTQENSSSELKVTLLHGQGVPFSMGGSIMLKVGAVGIFYGTLFDVVDDNAETIALVFRDQLTYLNTAESYTFGSIRATDCIRSLAKDFSLRVGQLDESGYYHEPMVFDSKNLLDIIAKYVGDLVRRTNRLYTFQDVYGSLTLKEVTRNVIPFVIGDMSLAGRYSYSRSILDAKNEIKLVQENPETKQRHAYIFHDSNTKKLWGRLLEVQSIDQKLPPGVAMDYGRALLALKNKESRNLEFSDCIGNISFLAGRGVYAEVTSANIKGLYIITGATHTFKGSSHTMNVSISIA